MRKILLYKDETGEHFAWDITTPKLYEDAWLSLFRFLDGQFQIHPVIGEQLRSMARRGNATYAKVYLELHRDGVPGEFAEVPVMPLELERRPIRLVKVVCPEALMDPPQADTGIQIEAPPTEEERKNEGKQVALP